MVRLLNVFVLVGWLVCGGFNVKYKLSTTKEFFLLM